jgi:hypothetical protein
MKINCVKLQSYEDPAMVHLQEQGKDNEIIWLERIFLGCGAFLYD